jgi:hypothetical protein
VIQNVQSVNPLLLEIDVRNQPAFVAADVEHDARSHAISMRIGSPEIG